MSGFQSGGPAMGGVPRGSGFEGQQGLESSCQCRRCKSCGFDPWVMKILWKRKWHPTPVFLLGEPNGQRSLVSYSPWGLKEPDMTQRQSTHTGFDHRSSMRLQETENPLLRVHAVFCVPVPRR